MSGFETLLAQARSAQRSGDLRQAQIACRSILQQRPDHPEANRRLGWIALQAGHADSAVDLYRRALAGNPDQADVQAELAQALVRTGDFQAALGHARHSAALRPDVAMARFILGSILDDLGRSREAADEFRAALALDPKHSRSFARLAELDHLRADDIDSATVAAMQQLARDPEVDAGDRAQAAFGLATLLDRQGEFDPAFEWYRLANACRRDARPAGQRYDRDADLRLLSAQQGVFTRRFLTRRKDWGDTSTRPVFVLGMPRTGSTLVERILGRHDRIRARSEIGYLRQVLVGQTSPAGEAAAISAWATASRTRIREAALRYIELMLPGQATHAPQPLPVDKMPANYELIGQIRLLFPDARIIHVRRDPVDTLWSCFRRDLSARYSNSFDDLLVRYELYRRHIGLWQSLPDIAMLDLRYEDLVRNPEAQTRRLFEFIGLDPPGEQPSRSHSGADGVATASRQQVRKPIYTDSIEAWRRYQAHLGDLERAVRAIDARLPA